MEALVVHLIGTFEIRFFSNVTILMSNQEDIFGFQLLLVDGSDLVPMKVNLATAYSYIFVSDVLTTLCEHFAFVRGGIVMLKQESNKARSIVFPVFKNLTGVNGMNWNVD